MTFGHIFKSRLSWARSLLSDLLIPQCCTNTCKYEPRIQSYHTHDDSNLWELVSQLMWYKWVLGLLPLNMKPSARSSHAVLSVKNNSFSATMSTKQLTKHLATNSLSWLQIFWYLRNKFANLCRILLNFNIILISLQQIFKQVLALKCLLSSSYLCLAAAISD